MFRIAASPARSQETWSLAATTTERPEMVVLIHILPFLLMPEADCRGDFARRAAFESRKQAAVLDRGRRPTRGIVAAPASNGNAIRLPRVLSIPVGLVSRRLKGYNGGWWKTSRSASKMSKSIF